jgi:hypothetical protein
MLEICDVMLNDVKGLIFIPANHFYFSFKTTEENEYSGPM